MNGGEADRGAWLIELASKGEDPTLSYAERSYNLQSLESLLQPDDVEYLVEFLEQDQERQVRVLAAATLGRTKSPGAIEPLGTILKDRQEDPMLRQAAAWAMHRIKDGGVVEYLGGALSDEDPDIKWTAARALEELKLPGAASYLGQALFDPDDRLKAVAVRALSQLDDPAEAAEYFREALKRTQHQDVRKAAAMVLGKAPKVDDIPFLGQTLMEGDKLDVRRTAAEALGRIGETAALSHLKEALREHKDPQTRLAAAQAVGCYDRQDAVQVLCQAVLSDQEHEVRKEAGCLMRSRKGVDWKENVSKLIRLVEDSGQKRGQIDAEAIVTAMSPSEKALAKNQYMLTDYLISRARGQDNRMTGILAKLITQSAGDSALLAGERVNQYQEIHKVPEDQLLGLRVEIGGETALDPILQTLKTNLDEHFQKPIHKLNKDTRGMWQRTMLYAQIGFIARITMSILVFLVGMVLVSVSSWQVLSGNLQLDLEQLLGPGVSFVSGLSTMLLIVYTGPLKQIKRSVNDLGIGSAAFIAYVHRVLEISHTFSFYYLKEKITFEEMGKSSELIKGAMNDTIKMLHEDTDKEEAATSKKPSAETAEKEESATEVPAKAKLVTEAAAKAKPAAELASVAAKEKATPASATEDERRVPEPPTKKEDT
jgi:HEAT repeat protein